MNENDLVFYWIDDEDSKVNPYIDVFANAIPGQNITLIPVIIKDDLFKIIEALPDKNPAPNLIIIDHIFNKVAQLPLHMNGSSIAHVLRRAMPNIPMVCVTSGLVQKSNDQFDQEDFSEYTAMFKYLELSENLERFFAIATGFEKIVSAAKNPRDELPDILGLPETERSMFLISTPSEFGDAEYSTTPHRVAKWLLDVFIERPGYLYSKLRVATYLGISEAGFDAVREMFRDAEYRGPFATDSRPMWWISLVEEILFANESVATANSSQEAGRMLAGIEQAHYSRCYVGENETDIPDVVAKLGAGGEEVAVCSRHTASEKNYTAIPGFETPLVVTYRQQT